MGRILPHTQSSRVDIHSCRLSGVELHIVLQRVHSCRLSGVELYSSAASSQM